MKEHEYGFMLVHAMHADSADSSEYRPATHFVHLTAPRHLAVAPSDSRARPHAGRGAKGAAISTRRRNAIARCRKCGTADA